MNQGSIVNLHDLAVYLGGTRYIPLKSDEWIVVDIVAVRLVAHTWFPS